MASEIKAIGLFTDFGLLDSYQGEVKARLLAALPQYPVFDLMAGAPGIKPQAAAYLLAGILAHLPARMLLICVVDPGVGSERKALLLKTQGHILLGPDNGLLSQVQRRRGGYLFEIGWRPEQLSPSFHGRDFFAPAAAMYLLGESLDLRPMNAQEMLGAHWSSDLHEIIHIDGFGNLITGISYRDSIREVSVQGRTLPRAVTFHEVPVGSLFWYENSTGLIEIAANQASAADLLSITPGEPVQVLESL